MNASDETPTTIPPSVRSLLEDANYVHLATVRRDGSPRSWVVWVGLEGDNRILVCTDDRDQKAKDMMRDPRVALSLVDHDNPYRMAALRGKVVEMRSDEDCQYMDAIAIKYTNRPFPARGSHRVCFVLAVEHSIQRTLGFEHRPTVDSTR